MDFKSGILEKIEQSSGVSKAGKPYTRFVYVVDGKKYSSFTEFPGVKLGDKVIMEGQQAGKFWNLENLKLDDGNQPLQVTEQKVTEQSRETFNTAQALIKISQQLEEQTRLLTQIRGLLSNEKSNTDKKED